MTAVAAMATARMKLLHSCSFVLRAINGDRPIPDSMYFPRLAGEDPTRSIPRHAHGCR